MGLDMYLKASKHTYISPYEDHPDYPKVKPDVIQQAVRDISIPDAFDPTGHRTFECTAISWRKANQIHHWFVQNVQNGEDDCGSYYVSRHYLKKLQEDIQTVLADMTKAQEVLPVSFGCFFGSQEYNEWYFQDLEYTAERLAKILAMPDFEEWSFEYQSSW
jgi:protoheme ferro-lyase